MSLQTPTTIRTRQWKLIPQGEDASRAGVSSLDTSIKRPTIVGLEVKPIGKPSAGNRHARFDERGWETERWPQAPSYRAHSRLYHPGSLRRCGDSVSFLRDGMPLLDPKQLFAQPCAAAQKGPLELVAERLMLGGAAHTKDLSTAHVTLSVWQPVV